MERSESGCLGSRYLFGRRAQQAAEDLLGALTEFGSQPADLPQCLGELGRHVVHPVVDHHREPERGPVGSLPAPLANRVTKQGPFDLDDLGGEVARQLGAERAGQNLAHLDDADIAERHLCQVIVPTGRFPECTHQPSGRGVVPRSGDGCPSGHVGCFVHRPSMNQRGVDRALDPGVDKVNLVVAATTTFSR